MLEDKLLARIKKVLALTKSDQPGEAAAAMELAQKLLTQHNLTLGGLAISEITHQDVPSPFSISKLKIYESALMNTIGRAFGCQIMFMKSSSYFADKRAMFTLVGPKHQVPVAAYTTEVLMRKLQRARAKFLDGFDRSVHRNFKTQQADGFCFGWVVKIAETVHEFSGAESYAPAILEYQKRTFVLSGDAVKAEDKKIHANSFLAGKKAAEGESLFRPMAGGSQEQGRLK